MMLNESTLTELGSWVGGSILRFALVNSGSARTSAVIIEGRATPESPWVNVADQDIDYQNKHDSLLGFALTDQTLNLMQIGPAVTGYVYVDTSRLCGIRVSAAGLPGSNLTVTVSLPNGLSADLGAVLASPAGAGLIGTTPGHTLSSTSVQQSLYELADDTTALAAVVASFDPTAINTHLTTLDGQVANRLRVDAAQGLTSPQKVFAKTNIDLQNVDNTSDVNKPVSTAQAAADALKANIASPTFTGTVAGITKAMVGLGSVDNTSDASKPVSTAQAAAIAAVTPTSLGLGNVTNTSDANKPVSTAQAAAIALKVDITNGTATNPTITNYVETMYTPAGATAFTVALTNGTLQKLATTGNCTITLPAAAVGKSFTLLVAYGGVHTLTWAGGGTIKWAGGSAPTATSVSGKFDIFVFTSDGTNTYGRSGGSNY